MGRDSQKGQVLVNNTVTSQTYVKRRQQVDDVCSVTTGGVVLRMAQHKQSNVAYCVIPKAGCTYWLSVLRWLQRDRLARKYSHPFDIPRHVVHGTSPPVNYYTFSSASQASRLLSHRFRFMFVREPYSRLWSSYVDKFLLPDFWHLDGRAISRRRPNATQRARTCGHDVTFSEFLAYVTSRDVRNLNPHYRPYHHVCSACLFRPHFVGKMETFANDSHYLLQRMNLTGLEAALRTPDQRALHEMTLLIQDAFHELDRYPAFFTRCTNSTDLARRLWRAFQINGYLPDDLSFPWAGGKEVDRESLKELVEEVYLTRRPKDQGLWSTQKERAMTHSLWAELRITTPPRNQTVLNNKRLKLPCKAQGGNLPIRIRWFRNGDNLNKRGDNYRISEHSGTLRFSRVRVIDRGEYRCKASNEFQHVFSDPAQLTVHAEATLIKFPQKEVIRPYSAVSAFTCEAAGIPMPSIQWKIDGEFVTEMDYHHQGVLKTDDIESTEATWRSTIHINSTRTAQLACVASNRHIEGVTVVSHTMRLIVRQPLIPVSSPPGSVELEESSSVATVLVWAAALPLLCSAPLRSALLCYSGADADENVKQ
ncbi:hypothetical protein ACOMHN_003439 [Nucella lapillus]